ncbi:MAG: PBP1A family penicillin-binding protein [SAR324 cluster bacterium]|nr:PBP1A family penicillin-binding protein [SAR324 cluster bacterium]
MIFNKPVIKWFLISVVVLGVLSITGVSFFLYKLSTELPENLHALEQPDYTLPTIIYDREGNQVDELFIHRRVVVPFESFPPHLIQALIASEDSRFWSHSGIDIIRMIKAFVVNLQAGGFAQGASTLTQQTARQFLLSREKKLIRKLKEILLAIRIERQFTKQEIITLYLNKVFLGNAEGVEASAQDYFGKHTEELSLSDCAMLVGLLPAPSLYAPHVNPELALRQRNRVLGRMEEEGFISPEEQEMTSNQPIKLSKIYDSTSEATAYFVEHARRYLIEKYGSEKLYNGGMKVYLTMDLDYQIAAHEALQKGILELDKRQGYLGPLKTLEIDPVTGRLSSKEIEKITRKNHFTLGDTVEGVIISINKNHALVSMGEQTGILEWTDLRTWGNRKLPDGTRIPIEKIEDMLSIGDVIQVTLEDFDTRQRLFYLSLHQEPVVNGALLAMVPQTGNVIAMSGGYSYNNSQFNRAIQAKRQPGSSFKPIVYSAALDAGYTLATSLVDSPIAYKTKSAQNLDEIWMPTNYGNKLLGEVSLKTALVKSLNLPTIRLVRELGPEHIIEYAKKLGIVSEMNNNLTIGLGTLSATLLEMNTVFATFANSGKRPKPIFISRVEDRNGEVLEEYHSESIQVISEETAFLMTTALREVVEHGTGWRARTIGRPSAGKTGTTNKSIDAWYLGYIPQLLTGIYVGYDAPQPMGKSESGSYAAAPIWVEFMKKATANMRTEQFPQPSSIVTLKIHKTGRRASPCDPADETFYEHFAPGTEPPVDPQQSRFCELQQSVNTPNEESPQEEEIDLQL